MTEHTLGPWMTSPCGELCPDDVMIVADLGKRDGIQQISTVAKALSLRQSAATTAANAEFIVRAVNSHDDLVAALTEALYYVGMYESENMSNVALDVVIRGRAALAKANAS